MVASGAQPGAEKPDWPGFYKNLEQVATSPDGFRQQASELLAQGDARRSKLLLERHLHSSPDDVEGLILLARSCLQIEDGLEEALVVARRSVEVGASGAGSLTSANVLAVALGLKARSPLLPPEIKSQIRQEAIAVLQSVSTSAVTQPVILYNLALLLAEAGDANAAEHAKQALQVAGRTLHTDLTDLPLALLALLLSARGQHQAALSVLSAAGSDALKASSAAITSVPTELLVARVRAQLLQAHGDTAASMAVLAKSKKRLSAAGGKHAELEAELWQDLALAFAAQGAHADALYCSDQSQQLVPWTAGTHYTLGCVLEAAGRIDEAINSFNTALSLNTRHAPSLLRLGVINRRTGGVGQAAVARDLLSEALRYDPSMPQGWYQLGLACKAMHHRADAERHLHTAVLLAASSPVLPYSTLPYSTMPLLNEL